MRLRTFFTGIIVIVAVFSFLLSSAYQQSISDWYFLRSYTPNTEVAALAERSGMSDTGARLFYVSDPEINQAEEFNENCPFKERSYVLGCYAQKRIYIYDITDERLDGVKEVTAAHEMLHVVYARMTDSEKDAMRRLLDVQLSQVSNQRILDLVDQYREQDPDSIYNEIHSIFGTELADLTPELEAHYAPFFTDRQIVADLAASYEAVFRDLRDAAGELGKQIAVLRQAIETDEANLRGLRGSIETLDNLLASAFLVIDDARDRNDADAESVAVERYNGFVVEYRVLVDRHNAAVAGYNQDLELHNQLVAEYNVLVGTQSELLEGLDSRQEQL